MTLDKYQQKRNFKTTPEPATKSAAHSDQLIFVVQRHKASRLHYDFRLEMDGVLKSWAIPKGPSMNPADKRLAIMVEDHPYDYKDFEGVIPPGNYGAGIVEIWDSGYYTDSLNSGKKAEQELLKALEAGHLNITLHGKKLKGEFALVKLKPSKDNSWLLIKHNDEYAVQEEYDSEAETSKNSPINKALSTRKKPSKNPKKAVASQNFDYIPPMLAKETKQPFDDKDWIFEIKWDGYRAIAELNKAEVTLYSRNGNLFNAKYPEITDALAQMDVEAVIDGEIVVMDEQGNPNFQLLQHYSEQRSHPIYYYVFDILKINNQSVMELPLVKRKELVRTLIQLRTLIKKNGIIKYSDHIEEKGKEMFALMAERNMEGIMAKKADSPYLPGQRTADWLKIKYRKTTDAIICGFTEPEGERKYFGALILGLMQGNTIKYIGHTGTGFDKSLLKSLYEQLKPLATYQSPFNETIKTNTPVTWVKPELVCEVEFTEKTRDGMLRNPAFIRLRQDKPVEDTTIASLETVTKEQAEIESSSKANKDTIIPFGRVKVPVSNWNKLYWPEEKITKGDVVEYYLGIADLILPYLKNRPQSLKRNPGGITDEGFFHKDAGENVPSFVKTIAVHSESSDKDVDYIICNNKATLTYLNNLGCIEINPWHSTIQSLDCPDYLIIDIDPSDKNTFEQVIETANVIHDILEKAGAANFCKTSGATGLHVYIPTHKKYPYDQLKDFAELVCVMANEQLPETTSTERSLSDRGDKIYLDYLQNSMGQTVAAPYSLRLYLGATVSTPLQWTEVKPGLTPAQFTIFTVPSRVKKTGDLFKGILGRGINMETLLNKMADVKK
ncbi:MAG TPA: DNA ligase D [Methylobacter sp.]|jgi:bifunctional non-homologous end joining protein LigD